MIYLSRNLIRYFSWKEIELLNWGKVLVVCQDNDIFFYNGWRFELIKNEWVSFSLGLSCDNIILHEYFHLENIKYVKITPVDDDDDERAEYIYKLFPYNFIDTIKLSINSIRVGGRYLRKGENEINWEILDEKRISCCVCFNPYLFGDFYVDLPNDEELRVCEQFNI